MHCILCIQFSINIHTTNVYVISPKQLVCTHRWFRKACAFTKIQELAVKWNHIRMQVICTPNQIQLLASGFHLKMQRLKMDACGSSKVHRKTDWVDGKNLVTSFLGELQLIFLLISTYMFVDPVSFVIRIPQPTICLFMIGHNQSTRTMSLSRVQWKEVHSFSSMAWSYTKVNWISRWKVVTLTHSISWKAKVFSIQRTIGFNCPKANHFRLFELHFALQIKWISIFAIARKIN